MEAISDKKAEQIEELEEEIEEMNEKLSEERKIYKEKLWHYVQEIAQVNMDLVGLFRYTVHRSRC